MQVLKGNVHPMARAEVDQGALDPSQVLHGVTIVFQRTAAQEQALEKLLQDQQDRSSANFHHWITPQEYAATYGLSGADLNKVKDWLTTQGFTIDHVAQGHNWITFSGSVGQISSTFKTELHQYSMNGKVHYANGTNPSIPVALASVVSSIRGLNNFRPHRRGSIHRVRPDFTSSISGSHYVAPEDAARIYNLSGLYAAGIDGTGQKIAVMGQTDIKLPDIATFRSVSGLPANVPTVILDPSAKDPGTVDGDLTEADLDIEWTGAVARNAQIIYVNSGNGAIAALQYAIDQNVAPVLSLSYGDCEQNFSTSDINYFISLGQQANAQGQTIVAPSGDDGAADCDYSTTTTPVTIATHGYSVDVPAAMPYVTGIGGTSFNEGNGTYWSATNNSKNGSALYYIPEIAWNDTTFEVANGGGLSASGGGASTFFTKPSWQTGTGVPNDGARDVPDVSFNGSLDHDGFIICSNGDCVNGYRFTDSTLDVVGGTSAGVPVFAGMVALINQKMKVAQGNVNPRLYQLAASAPYVFHDITSGDNKVPCQSGTTDCPNGGSIGFTAGTGYDLVTGLGSIDASNLVNNWDSTAKAPSADFGVEFFDPSALTLTRGSTSSAGILLHRLNGFNGTVALSCTVSGLSGVTCAVSPNSANPDAAATVTLTSSASAALILPSNSPWAPWSLSTFAVLGFMGIGWRKAEKKQLLLAAGILVLLVAALVSCGGGGSSSNNGSGGGTGGNQTGTVTVTGTSGSLTHTAQLNVTLQ